MNKVTELKFKREVTNTLSQWLSKVQIEKLRSNALAYRRIREDLNSQPDWVAERKNITKVINHAKGLSDAINESGRKAQAEMQTVSGRSGLGYLEFLKLPKKLGEFSEALRTAMCEKREQNRRKNHAQLVAMIDSVTSETGMKPSRSDLSPFLEICTSIFNSLELEGPERSIKAFLDDRRYKHVAKRPSH